MQLRLRTEELRVGGGVGVDVADFTGGSDTRGRRHSVVVPPQTLKQFLEHVRVLGVDQLELFREEHDVVDQSVEVWMQLQLD